MELAFAYVLLFGLFAGFLMGCGTIYDKMRKKAIDNGAAKYDATTGVFTWNDEVK